MALRQSAQDKSTCVRAVAKAADQHVRRARTRLRPGLGSGISRRAKSENAANLHPRHWTRLRARRGCLLSGDEGMPTTVTVRSVMQQGQASAPGVQTIFSNREFLRGIEGPAEVMLQTSRKRGRQIKRRTIPALAANTSAGTSTGNSRGFDPVFATQTKPFARPGDVFTGISASGDSRNILLAVLIAGSLRAKVLAWTGGTDGKVEKRRGRLPLHTVERSDTRPASTPLARHAISEFVERGRQRR
jgi:hypothetical protein